MLLFQFQPSSNCSGMAAFQRIIKKTLTYLITELTTTVFVEQPLTMLGMLNN